MTDAEKAAYIRTTFRNMHAIAENRLADADAEFSRLSEKRLNEPYGASGRPARVIWDEYRKAYRLSKEALEWLEELLAERNV